ncbi:hypothetical protein DMUE_1863 [Dictyocoela muelleri]|nr:hypothetical protein DMUE_1863 [Dictyocoela muelleri]
MSIIDLTRLIGIITGLYSFKNISYARDFLNSKQIQHNNTINFEILYINLDYVAQILTIITLLLLIINYVKKIENLKILVPVVCSLQFIVTITHWGLYVKDVKYILNSKLVDAGFIPFLPQDICLHGLPYLIILINSLHFSKRQQIEPKIIIIMFFLVYMFISQIIYFVVGEYPLRFLEYLDKNGQLLFFPFCAMIGIIHYEIVCFHSRLFEKL